jgi:uncharacterized protein YndB with AHSA1/START domain
MRRDIVVEKLLQHPPQAVWRALTDPRALAEWLMVNDFEPRVGHKFQFRDRPRPGWDGTTHCEVLECREPHVLKYSWRGGPLDTVVTFRLEPIEGGTRLVLEHRGFAGLFPVLVSYMMSSGWKKMLRGKLLHVLARIGDEGFVPDPNAAVGCRA